MERILPTAQSPVPLAGAIWLFGLAALQADYPIMAHRHAADPSALVHGQRLYLYASNDDENGTNGYSMTSIVCFSTEDLKNWTDHGIVFSATQHTTWASYAWAPSVVHRDGVFYLYFANGGASIGVATSSLPTGPFRDARGSPLISASTPGAASPTQWYFDPCAFLDDDGQGYLYFGGQYPTNARVIRLAGSLVATEGVAVPLVAPDFFEAIHVHKAHGLYHLTYSTRPEAGMTIAYAVSTNPMHGFQFRGTLLPNPPQNLNNNNHHGIVYFRDQWYIAYHNRAAALEKGLTGPAAVYKRSLGLDRLNHAPDGTLLPATATADSLGQLTFLDPYRRVEGETMAQSFGIRTASGPWGVHVIPLMNGAWIRLRGVNFGVGPAQFLARVACGGAGGTIELRLHSPTGSVLGTLTVPYTGGDHAWTTLSVPVNRVTGVHDLYLRFSSEGASPIHLDWWRLQAGANAGAPSDGATDWVVLEAEQAHLGSDWRVVQADGVTAITITSSRTGTSPGGAQRIATWLLVFPAPGLYELYARVRVGPGGWNDDSFFYANRFGDPSPTEPTDWVLVNGLASAGFTNPSAPVQGRGTAGLGVWKWIALSQYTDASSGPPVTFTVPEGGLVQSFAIGGREDGLDIDRLVFVPAGRVPTVAELDAARTTPSRPGVFLNTSRIYQTIEGLGGALCFYNGWITAHPYKHEIYQHAFAGLNLSLLRLGNWFRYTNAPDTAAYEFVAQAERILGRPVPVLMSSWAPPAFLKSNGQTGGGGTLLYRDGRFLYEEFAQYWYDALQAYRSNGVWPTWISIQNEPDWEADYDSCIFRPVEGPYRGTNYASYARALEAVHRRLSFLPDPPLLLAPEVVHIRYNTLASYAATLNPETFYGVAYHLYGDSVDGTVDGYVPSLQESLRYFPDKPRFMTEYGLSNMLDTAILLHHCLTVGQVSGFSYWSLVWPGVDGGLIQIEFPWDRSRWTNAPPGTPTQSRGYWIAPAYWALKHYSYFVEPGSRRIDARSTDPNVLATAFLTPDNLRLITVLINRHPTAPVTVHLQEDRFVVVGRAVYQTTSTDAHSPTSPHRFRGLGDAGTELILPPGSVTTVVWDAYVALGSAQDPMPAPGATGVPSDVVLSWTPGTNATLHAVYLGTDSNRVALVTPADPEFRGWTRTPSMFVPGLEGFTTYYWRVDSIARGNTNVGPVWSFVTGAAPSLRHRYDFQEAEGPVVVDRVGGPAWNGWLPNGGMRSRGVLRLAAGSQQYVALPPGIVQTLEECTFAVWVRLASIANWARIFDLGNNTQSNLFLTARNGSNGRLRFAITVSGSAGEQRIDGPVLSAGVWYHIVVTLRGRTGILYVNGSPVGTNAALTLRPASLGNTLNNYLGRSQYTWDPYLDAELDEFQIYRVALTPREITALYRLGPDQLLAETPPTLRVGRLGDTVVLAWPLTHAGFSLQVATNLAEPRWRAVLAPEPVLSDNQWQVTLPRLEGPLQFYRLAR